ncbi:hypothetical protein ACMD2_18305 [Ananas comosus]|nr:hypothetical protein ACMD2_18305 [Ananas comosus]
MFCGTSSFKHIDGDDPRAPVATSPKGSKKKAGNKNPYSTRGLDKFSAVLLDLESQRQKIMARAGSQGVAMVQFMYKSTNDWIPVVVRLRNRQDEESRVSGAQKLAPASPTLAGDGGAGEAAGGAKAVAKEERKGNKGFAWGGWRESHSWMLVVVVMLVCIVVFGRVFAICCTSICWYLVPSLKGGSGMNERRFKMGREQHARRLSDKRLGAKKVVGASSLANKMNNIGRRA